MSPTDRRTSHDRRAARAGYAHSLGGAITEERRGNDRRQTARRRSDMRSIADFAGSIDLGGKRLEVILDGHDGLRLVAMFECGCLAIEPIGDGHSAVRIEACAPHRLPIVVPDRRRPTEV